VCGGKPTEQIEKMTPLALKVNGKVRKISIDGNETLLEVLRVQLGLTGAKRGCNQGVCGSCTVLIDGHAARSCLCLAGLSDQSDIITVEGLATNGELSPMQQAFVDSGAVQCGFCMPGMVIAATALLAENSKPNDDEIREGLAGNLCRCSGYVKVAEAVRTAAGLKGVSR
jgi:carbon-monoxide dehydrogenase small subunit